MRIRELAAEADQEAALQLAEAEFGGLDLPGSSVRQELASVLWTRSVGIMDEQDSCLGFILAAPLDLPAYGASQSDLMGFEAAPLAGLAGVRGDALVIRPEARPQAVAMLRRFLISSCAGCDYVWGTAHADLNNGGFWGKHARILGQGDDGEIVFAIPLNDVAAAAMTAAKDLAQATGLNPGPALRP